MGLGEQKLHDELVWRPVERPDGNGVEGEGKGQRTRADRERPTPAGSQSERDDGGDEERRPRQLEEEADPEDRETGLAV